MKVLDMAKIGETPHFAFRCFLEENSVIVALEYSEKGTSAKTGEAVPEEEREAFVPVFGMRFFQEGSLKSLITHCGHAIELLKKSEEGAPDGNDK